MPDNDALHARLTSSLRARLEVARADDNGACHECGGYDTAAEIRRVEALLVVVEALPPDHWIVRDLAAGEGIEVGDG